MPESSFLTKLQAFPFIPPEKPLVFSVPGITKREGLQLYLKRDSGTVCEIFKNIFFTEQLRWFLVTAIQ